MGACSGTSRANASSIAVSAGGTSIGFRAASAVEDPRSTKLNSALEEARYLAPAPEPLASVASVLTDTGMRPEECFRLRWENLRWLNAQPSSLRKQHSKAFQTIAEQAAKNGGKSVRSCSTR